MLMYFSSPNKHDILKGRVFLSPHIGISSLFIIDKKDLINALPYNISKINFGYNEWNIDNSLLQKPLDSCTILHNIDIPNVPIIKGISYGYIHVIDIPDKVYDNLKKFVTDDPDRELIYDSNKPLNIQKIIKHRINWTMIKSEEKIRIHGSAKLY